MFQLTCTQIINTELLQQFMYNSTNKLFNNHTSDNIFQEFEQKFGPILHQKYTHLSALCIDCYTILQYKLQKNVPLIEGLSNDAFAFSVDAKSDAVFAAIIISPELYELFNFTEMEKMAAIAHEVGHIIHYFNETLNAAGTMMIEIKADEVAAELGLAEPLKSVLHKLKSSKQYSKNQCQLMDLRIQILNYYDVS